MSRKKKDNTIAKCERCGRDMRPQRALAADWPGTVSRSSTKCCQACKNAEANGTGPLQIGRFKAGTKCSTCKRPMRPNGTVTKLYPGMKAHKKDNTCRRCYLEAERTAEAAKAEGTKTQTPRKRYSNQDTFGIGDRPAGLTSLELLSRIGLEKYIEDRRTRGVSKEGFPLEKWISQNQVVDNERPD